jgi:3-phenylpropionate/trans-cinnamate dioxygenase ferredoxin reductase subunit
VSSNDPIVIVGASLAGVKAAEALRQHGFDDRIVLLGEEPEPPYQRPPLSKQYLAGQADLDDVYLHTQAWYDDLAVEVLTSTRVTALDPGTHRVTLADGATLAYRRLLLATGSTPRRLDVPGAQLAGIHYLRTLADTERLKQAAASATAAAVVGSGWLGAEVTASLRQHGLPVTMLDLAAEPLERVLGQAVGRIYRDLHTQNGATLLMNTGVAAFQGHRAVEALLTTDGRQVNADLVVIAVGATPRTELAEAAGLAVEDGIVTDEYLGTSAPDVYAAGDVANAWHPLYGTHLRIEHWANALNQGLAAGVTMCGSPSPYERVPYFFSDQYDLGMEYSGHAAGWDQVVLRGDRETRKFIAFWLRDGLVVAAMNANVWDVTEPLQQLIRQRGPIDPARLADPDVPLTDLITKGTS